MALRSAIGQHWTYLQGDAAQDRAKQSYNRIDVSWRKGAWPHLAFNYAQNTASNTMDPFNFYPQRASPHTLEAAAGYSGGIWDAKLASAYGIEADLLNHGAESQVRTQTMTASLRPIPPLTITPSLGYRAERPEWSSARIDAPSASLSMNYKQSHRLSITAAGNYLPCDRPINSSTWTTSAGKESCRGSLNHFETGNRNSLWRAAIIYRSIDSCPPLKRKISPASSASCWPLCDARVLPTEGHIAAAQQLEPLTDRRVTVRRGHKDEVQRG